jgi:DNA adenine methylase
MYSKKLYTPLRYPGGKARFAPLIADVMRANGLDGGHYMEPYAGGAGVALELLFEGVATDVHINDVDPAVADFWLAATKHNQRLIRMVESEPVTMEAWYYWRSVMLGEVRAGLIKRGFATLFMNRTNRSGILKAGVVGGKAQKGSDKLDARFMREALSTRLQRIGENAGHIHVYCEDAHDLLSRCGDFLPSQSLIYLDPPYYEKGQGLYRNFYEHEDHLELAKLIQSRAFPRKWVVSYDDADEIQEMYKRAKTFTYGLNYTAHVRYLGQEAMFFRPGLRLPA